MAVPFLWANINTLTQHVGHVAGNFNANVANRLTGSPVHLLIVQSRVGISAVIGVMAILGAIRRFCAGYGDLTFAVLAIAPFPLLAMQNYGGEMVNRLYFFVLPFAAFFATALFYHHQEGGTSW